MAARFPEVPRGECETAVQLVTPDGSVYIGAEAVLRQLAQAGAVVSKDALVTAAWNEVAVTDNSLEQAVSALRRLLGRDLPQAWPQPFANGAALAFALGLTRLMFAR